MNPPIPNGPYNDLCPAKAKNDIFIMDISTLSTPKDCAVSKTVIASYRFAHSKILSIGSTYPVTLLICMEHTHRGGLIENTYFNFSTSISKVFSSIGISIRLTSTFF